MSEVSEHAKAALQRWRDNREMTLGEAVQASIDSATAELRMELEEVKQLATKSATDHLETVKGLERIVSERDSLKREVEGLRMDKERLDWLEANPFTAYHDRDPENNALCGHFTLVDEDRVGKYGRWGIVKESLRQAIDAALNQREK